jgi:hypothetical protein
MFTNNTPIGTILDTIESSLSDDDDNYVGNSSPAPSDEDDDDDDDGFERPIQEPLDSTIL